VSERCDGTGKFSHQALFYRGTKSYLAEAVPFVLRGVAEGEFVVVAVPGHRLRPLEQALGPAVDRVHLFDMSEMGRNPGRLLPTLFQILADAHGEPVRVFGEPVWSGRSEEEYPACVQHEAMLNFAFAGWSARFLCAYDMSALGPEVLADAEATHTALVDFPETRPSTAYDPEAAYERYNVPLPAPEDALLLPFDVESMSKVRRVAAEFAALEGLGQDRLQDVALAVGELCANSVQHGGGSGVFATWQHDDGSVVYEVADRGRLTDRMAGRKPPAAHQRGGWGLLLVNQVSDLVRAYAGPEGLTTRVYLRH